MNFSFPSLVPGRWNVGCLRVSSRVSDPGCYDTAGSSTRGETLLVAICDGKVFTTEQLSGSFCMGRAATCGRNYDVYSEGI